MRTLIIADDLTGALDVAGPFAQRGVDTRVVVDADKDWAARTDGAEVVSVNANTRHLSAQAAAERVTAILSQAKFQEGLLIKKIDSTLRGQVVPETIAMLHESGRGIAIVTPAFPAQGRTVRGGVVHVAGVPLAQTAFAKDALSPPPLAPLKEVFLREGIPCVSTIAANLSAISTRGSQAIVVDAQSDVDLLQTVQAFETTADQVLWVGSAGIAQAIAAGCYALSSDAKSKPHCQGGLLVVVGSRAAQSTQQVDNLLGYPGVTLIDAPNGVVDVSSLGYSPITLLRAVPGPHGEGDAEEVARSLAQATAKIIARHHMDAVIATGGDTARAILGALHTKDLRVMGDLMPGVPYSQLVSDSHCLWLVSKAGGFGTPSTLIDIVTRLRA